MTKSLYKQASEIFNDSEKPELKYEVIKNGKILKDNPIRLLFETNVLNEYFDLRHILVKYGLSKVVAN